MSQGNQPREEDTYHGSLRHKELEDVGYETYISLQHVYDGHSAQLHVPHALELTWEADDCVVSDESYFTISELHGG